MRTSPLTETSAGMSAGMSDDPPTKITDGTSTNDDADNARKVISSPKRAYEESALLDEMEMSDRENEAESIR